MQLHNFTFLLVPLASLGCDGLGKEGRLVRKGHRDPMDRQGLPKPVVAAVR
jgi:hypothetical protein